ncbi:MAG: hypothetical protein WB402_04220 [Sulfuricaulis sp.]|uniref:hypothetical protein n=1 Tax=Sulfuricaulis sp. TaxID=2003553 RepID=UPI003C5D0B89
MEIVGPEQFGTHLICAMGDTEQDIPKVAQKIRDMGGHNQILCSSRSASRRWESGRRLRAISSSGRYWRIFSLSYTGRDINQMQFDASVV